MTVLGWLADATSPVSVMSPARSGVETQAKAAAAFGPVFKRQFAIGRAHQPLGYRKTKAGSIFDGFAAMKPKKNLLRASIADARPVV